MNISLARLQKLHELMESEPADPFIIYAIALEYQKIEPKKAIYYYEILMERHENYLPTYYQAAALYTELGLNEKARSTYEKGIQIAALQHNLHTQQELQNAFHNHLLEG
jgi:tetratricopeptide (TPR) repeat protein